MFWRRLEETGEVLIFLQSTSVEWGKKRFEWVFNAEVRQRVQFVVIDFCLFPQIRAVIAECSYCVNQPATFDLFIQSGFADSTDFYLKFIYWQFWVEPWCQLNPSKRVTCQDMFPVEQKLFHLCEAIRWQYKEFSNVYKLEKKEQSSQSLGVLTLCLLQWFVLRHPSFCLWFNTRVHFPFWKYKQSAVHAHVPNYLRAYLPQQHNIHRRPTFPHTQKHAHLWEHSLVTIISSLCF